MKIKITKLEQFFPNQVAVIKVGDILIGEINSWAEIVAGNVLNLKFVTYYHLNNPGIEYENHRICTNIKEILTSNTFKTAFALYKIEKL